MRDVVGMFRDYARLDLKRIDQGLSVKELEQWQALKEALDGEFRLGGPGSGRRSSERVKTHLNCSYASPHALGNAIVTNLATGGVFIETVCPLPLGSQLKLRIRLEDTDTEIEVDGVVVSQNLGPHLEPGARGMGVRFSGVSVDVVEQISALYAQELGREVAGSGRAEAVHAQLMRAGP